MKSVEEIVQNGICIGCGLCEGVLPGFKMVENKNGFLEPTGDFSTISENNNKIIIKSCPGLNQVFEETCKTKTEKIWGPIKKSEIGFSTNEVIRFRGSSGGVLTAIGTFLISQKLVTGVLQNSVSSENPFLNEFILSRNEDEVLTSSGSRYAPTSILSSLPQILQSGEVIAVIGKPCDIAAVKNYLKLNPEFKAQIPYVFSFFCAGQPSYTATDKLLDKLNCKKKDIKEFRYRGHGWPGDATAITFEDKSYKMSYENSWGKILGREIHFRCKICPDGIGMFADLVCGDAWESINGYPDFEEKKGKSLILARTDVGVKILEALKSKGVIVADIYPTDKLPLIQPYQENRRIVIGARYLAAQIAGIKLNFRGFNMTNNTKYTTIKLLLSNLYGTFKRAAIIKKNNRN